MHEIKLPQLGQSVEEASIVKWFKQEGEPVKKGDVLFSVQTDKAEIECESTADGVLRKILVPPDELVPVMTVVALVGEPDEPLPQLVSSKKTDVQATASTSETVVVSQEVSAESFEKGAAPSPERADSQSRAFVSPRARKRAEELGVDPSKVPGSGISGRVMSEDVDRYAEAYSSVKTTPTARKIAAQTGVDLTKISGSGISGRVTKADVLKANTESPEKGQEVWEGERKIPLTPMRRIIAQRMCSSMFSAPHYYVTVEVDMLRASQFRLSLGNFKPSFNVLLMYAVGKALAQVPQVNARWDDDAITELGNINLGFAVALPTGLVVPVIKNVQDKTLEQLDEESRTLTEKARKGKLLPDDYSGSTFTISNLGPYGIDHFTAIINPPNSAILAVGRIHEKPIAINGGVFVRPMMSMTLSSDHRVIDGALAAQFMGVLREILEKADF